MSDATRPTVIDADGHVTEPPAVWSGYVESAYRERAPRWTLDEHRRPCMILDGKLIMRHVMLLTLGPEYVLADYKPQMGGWDPAARLADMDSEGIDVAVLFPSIGLYVSDVDGRGAAWPRSVAPTTTGLPTTAAHAPTDWSESRCFRSSTSRNRSASSSARHRAARLPRRVLPSRTPTPAGRSIIRTYEPFWDCAGVARRAGHRARGALRLDADARTRALSRTRRCCTCSRIPSSRWRPAPA